MNYGWAVDFGLLIMVIGTTRYSTDTTLNYVEPLQPPNVHPNIRAGSAASYICIWNLENDIQRRDWAVFKGSKRAICEKIREALNL